MHGVSIKKLIMYNICQARRRAKFRPINVYKPFMLVWPDTESDVHGSDLQCNQRKEVPAISILKYIRHLLTR